MADERILSDAEWKAALDRIDSNRNAMTADIARLLAENARMRGLLDDVRQAGGIAFANPRCARAWLDKAIDECLGEKGGA